jgi:hypothetical protein
VASVTGKRESSPFLKDKSSLIRFSKRFEHPEKQKNVRIRLAKNAIFFVIKNKFSKIIFWLQ